MENKKPDAIIIDLEGTLTDHSHRKHLWEGKNYHLYNKKFIDDTVNEIFLDHLKGVSSKIIICTAKKVKHHSLVTKWLKQNNLYDMFFDIIYRGLDDERRSVEVKRDMVSEIGLQFNIIAAYDDQKDICQMYFDLGIKSYLVDTDGIYKFNSINSNQVVPPNEILMMAANLFKLKNAEYGAAYLRHGNIMAAFFPDGIALNTPEDFFNFHLFELDVIKSNRLAGTNLKHKDSWYDKMVYSAMAEGGIKDE